ncbi:MAG: hypothetical protein EBZ13_11475 [Planctomycetia bacterium]|nr:hypothetical protein [Planctomycetia bacterium]
MPDPVLATTTKPLLALPSAQVASVTQPALPVAQTLRLPVALLESTVVSVPLLAKPTTIFSHRFGGGDQPAALSRPRAAGSDGLPGRPASTRRTPARP